MSAKQYRGRGPRGFGGAGRVSSSLVGMRGRPFFARDLIRYAWQCAAGCPVETRMLEFIVDQIDPPHRREIVVQALSLCATDEVRTSFQAALNLDLVLDADDVAKFLYRAVGSKQVDYDEKRLRVDLRAALLATARRHRRTRVLGPDRIRELVNLFSLDDDDVQVLVCGLCYRQSSSFENLCDRHAMPMKIELLSMLLRLDLQAVQTHIGEEGRLAKCGIVTPMEVGNPMSFISVHSGVVGYLLGIGNRPLTECYCRIAGPSVYGLDSFPVGESSVRIVTALLGSNTGCHILLHGEPGTGKTEFAKAVAAAAGRPAYLVHQQDEDAGSDRRQALHAAVGLATGTGGVVIVDEADDVLNTRYAFLKQANHRIGKGWLNDFLDETRQRIIWITNDVDSIEDSTLRRFTYSIKFLPATVRQRQAVWLDHARRSPLAATVDAELARDLASAYRTSPAGVATAVQLAARALAGETGRDAVVDTLREALDRQDELLDRQHGKLRPIDTRYDLDALNTSPDIRPVVGFLQGWQGLPPKGRRPANLLFWGMPGTGKTEFAKYLGRQLGLEVVLRRASDLLSKWVGGTEKQIQEAFREAEREGAILLLDEADSFFISRDTAVRSWESSQTNELLTQMENHSGILICCTNRRDSLDRAALRRFAWKVEFRPLTEESRLRLYSRYFGSDSAGMPQDMRRRMLALPELTAGDLKAVSERFAFAGKDALDHTDIVAALEDEARHRRFSHTLPIGFHGG